MSLFDCDEAGKPLKPTGDVEVQLKSGPVNYRVYVPSRGRVTSATTPALLLDGGVRFYMVVEPQEALDYAGKFGIDNILVLPESNRGIVFVRNWIKRHSLSVGDAYHWQVDDNIRRFARRVGDKNVECSAGDLLASIEASVSKFSNIGICSPIHTAFAFAASNDVTVNRQAYSCVLVDNSIDVWWRDNCVEDTDYSLQVLRLGYCTLLFNRLLMEKATTMSMGGGNTEIEYGDGGRSRRTEGLMRLWPGIFRSTIQYGRIKVLPSKVWGDFRQRPKRKIENKI